MGRDFPGEFEQMLLLAVLRSGDHAFGLEVREELDRVADRTVSRSAFYTTLDRMEEKGWVRWKDALPPGADGGRTQRLFSVTDEGLEVLHQSRKTLLALWSGLEGVLERGRR